MSEVKTGKVHDADDRFDRVVRVQLLEQRDELDAVIPVLDVGKEVTRVQIDAGQDRYRAPADILVVAPYGRGRSRDRRQIRGSERL